MKITSITDQPTDGRTGFPTDLVVSTVIVGKNNMFLLQQQKGDMGNKGESAVYETRCVTALSLSRSLALSL